MIDAHTHMCKTMSHCPVRLLRLVCVAGPRSTIFSQLQKTKDLFKHHSDAHLQPIISARKCANKTEKMSSWYCSTIRKLQHWLWRLWVTVARRWVSRLFAYFELLLVFVYVHVHSEWKICCSPPRKSLLSWTQAWCWWFFYRPWTQHQQPDT